MSAAHFTGEREWPENECSGESVVRGDLDEVMKEAGKHAHLYWVQLLYTNECLS